MKLVLSCSLWLESIARKEIEMLGYTVLEWRDRVIIFDGDEEAVAKVNMWSRVGNKVYILLGSAKEIDTFDGLYESISKVPWKKYIDGNPVIVNAKSIHSALTSTPTIQKISKRAIVDVIGGKGSFIEEDGNKPVIDIEIVIVKDEVLIMLDTSGDGLHKRWYRKSTVEAPLKENLAAWLVLLSGWRFKEPFYDVFCGSGTIIIEAAMIAQNRAPWLLRDFAYEKFSFFPVGLKEKVVEEAKKKLYTWSYTLIASDIDEASVELAQENAKNAGVESLIQFSKKDFTEYEVATLSGTIVSNPPYGDRLIPSDIDSLYQEIRNLFRKNPELSGWIITSYEFDTKERDMWKRRKLFNWGKEVVFYKKNIIKK